MTQRSHRAAVLTAVLSSSIALVAGGAALAEEGDGGDPTAVTLRVAVAPGTPLARTVRATVRAYSQAAGPQTSAYTGTARLGIDRSGPGIELRSTVAEVSVTGTVDGTGVRRIAFSSRQIRSVREAARRAGKRIVALNVVLRDRTAGRDRTAKVNAFFRLHVR